MNNNLKIGLGLSGGGYRAAAYHLGTLKKLHEMKILDKVDVISTISGGSILGGAYCLQKDEFLKFEADFKKALSEKSVIKVILTSWYFIRMALYLLFVFSLTILSFFTQFEWICLIVFIGGLIILVVFQFSIFPASKSVQKAYDSFFYHNAGLEMLREDVKLIIGSTNLETGRPFSFSSSAMGDTTYWSMKDQKGAIKFNPYGFPISKAVTASSCVPFAFTPVSIEKKFFLKPEDYSRINPQLVDGGVYDNQGIHKLTFDSEKAPHYVIISDAGNRMSGSKRYGNTISLLMRTCDIFMNRIKNFQMMKSLYQPAKATGQQIAYLSLGWEFDQSIPGFVRNLEADQIHPQTLQYFNIPKDWIDDVEKFREDIIDFIEKKISFKEMKSNAPSKSELEIARGVGTNLTKLKQKQIDALMKHAAIMTEIQVKLYCPHLI